MSETAMPVMAEPRQFRASRYFVGAVLLVMAAHQISGTWFNASISVLLLLGAAEVLRALRWGWPC